MPKGHTPKTDWSDKDYELFEKWIRGVLRTNATEIVFTKKDGTERTMRCTLDPEFLPLVEITEGKKKKKDKDPEIISVFDTEKQAWRSFNIRSVRSVKFSIGDPPLDDKIWPFPTGEKP